MFKSKHVLFFFPPLNGFLSNYSDVQRFSSFLLTILTSLYFFTQKVLHATEATKNSWSHNAQSWVNCGWRCREREVSKKPQRAAVTIHSNKHTQESSIKTKWHLRSTEYVKHCPAEPHRTRSTKWTTLIWVAFLTSGWSQCFPDYFWVSGNVAGASALWVTPHRSQRMSVATNTPLSTSHLKRQCSYLGQVCPIVQCNVILWWSNATHSSWYVPWR